MKIAEVGPGMSGIRFVRLKDLPQVELYRAARRIQANPRHIHSVFGVTVSERGVGIHRTREGAFAMTPGSIAVINCGESHSGDVPPGGFSSTRTIRLQPDFLADCLGQIAGQRQDALRLPQPVIHDPRLARFILRLFDLLDRPGTRLEKEHALFELLEALHARSGRSPLPVPAGDERLPIRRACEFLRERCSEQVRLEELASLTGMNPFHLAKVFTRHVGVPPHTFQIQLRLKKATDLLATGASYVEAALEAGFCDQSHFCRAFKKKFGVTPAEYLR